MATYALIQNGVIVNTVLADSKDFQDPSYVWVDIDNIDPLPSIGWTTTDNINFSIPPLTAEQQKQNNDATSIIVDTGTPSGQASVVVDCINTSQRDALIPIQGSLIFNTDTSTFEGYDGNQWNDLTMVPVAIVANLPPAN